MSKFDWVFVVVFYTHGIALLLFGFHSIERLAGCGLFGMLLGFAFMCVSALSIKLDDYR